MFKHVIIAIAFMAAVSSAQRPECLKDSQCAGRLKKTKCRENKCTHVVECTDDHHCPPNNICMSRFGFKPYECMLDPALIPSSPPSQSDMSCTGDHDCTESFHKCKEGECTFAPELIKCSYCSNLHWTNCSYRQRCPGGFHKVREENKPCYWNTKRFVCRKRHNCHGCKHCGGHLAKTCEGCPYQPNGDSKGESVCNGDCKWQNNKCVDK